MSFVGDAFDSVSDNLFGGGVFGTLGLGIPSIGGDFFGKDLFPNLTGENAAEASLEAANIQAQTGREAIQFQREALEQTRGDLAPFREFGQGVMPDLQSNLQGISRLINDPNAQAQFIQDNPFFDMLAADAQRRIFNQAGASGRGFAGGTAQALQNSIMLLGPELVNQSIGQRQNLATQQQNSVTVGQNAAARQATATQQAGNNIANLMTGIGNTQAAGVVGAANATQQGVNNFLGLGGLGIRALAL